VSASLREQLAARVLPAMADVSISSLARETGASRTYLTEVRAGRTEPSSDMLDKIARALWLTVTVEVTQ
jgi:transcriptional regulator with XRE-family HTH domain